jgi:hypothetical protein
MQRRLTAPDGTVRLDRFKTGNLAVEKTFAIRTPFKRHRRRPRLSRREKAVNRSRRQDPRRRGTRHRHCQVLGNYSPSCTAAQTSHRLLASLLVLQLVEEQRHSG